MAHTNTQLLNPIGALARVGMLERCPLKTKLRITDHKLQLVYDSIQERIFYRPFFYGDSNENISGLYAAVVIFIETFLMRENDVRQPSVQFGFSASAGGFVGQRESVDPTVTEEKLKLSILRISQCFRRGAQKLQETYNFNNGVFALQFFCNLLKSAECGKYDKSMLPKHLSDVTSSSLLDEAKIKQIWKPELIIALGESLHACSATQNQALVNSELSKIETLLNDREIEFQKLVQSMTNLTINTPRVEAMQSSTRGSTSDDTDE
jgi:hypothetical protein